MTEVDRAAARVVAAMNDLLDRAAVSQGFADLDPAILDGVTIPVGNGLAGDAAARAAASALSARALDVVRGVASGVDVWRNDGVFCLQCGDADCQHTQPPEPTDVFAGYLPTGKPSWVDFTHFCMDRGIEGFETLFVPRPGVIAVALSATDLAGELIESFRDGAYTVAGAVVAGLIPADFEPVRAGQGRIAVSLVAVVRIQGGSLSIRLNQIGIDPEILDQAAGNQAHRGPAERIRRLLAATRARLEAVAMAIKHDVGIPDFSDAALMAQRLDAAVMPVMNRLRSDLVAVFSGVEDRTKHGEHRSRSGLRPTSTAFTDAAGASDEKLFFDMAEKTVVVVGPRGRCHVFTRDARHVTSLTLEPGDLDLRVTRKRWRPLEPALVTAFRQALGRRRGGESRN